MGRKLRVLFPSLPKPGWPQTDEDLLGWLGTIFIVTSLLCLFTGVVLSIEMMIGRIPAIIGVPQGLFIAFIPLFFIGIWFLIAAERLAKQDAKN